MQCRCRIAALFAFALSFAAPAAAAELPPIKTSPQNPVPACATPGRLMAYVQSRNSGMDSRFDGIATHYMRHGEDLGIRWDFAFFQMIVETTSLSFQRDVQPDQNNFAGLGAASRGEPGESFADLSAGVKAHLQHLLMYSGVHVRHPVAERTRKVQEWGILTSWQKSFKSPITFADLAGKWAPKERGYAGEIETVAGSFYGEYCERPDPKPELVQEARRTRSGADGPAKSTAAGPDKTEQEPARPTDDSARSSLGAQSVAPQAAAAGPAKAEGTRGKTALSSTAAIPAPQRGESADKPAAGASPIATVQAGAAAGAKSAAPAAKGAMKCRVWTASYGGTKAVIIKAIADQYVNYTVLDVNEGSEKREMEAYIAAYARGGEPVGTFATQSQALDKAFELCPEG